MRTITGVVTNKTKKWLTVKLDKYNSTHSDFVFVNSMSATLEVGDRFKLDVNSKSKYSNGNLKWFHVPTKTSLTRIVLGVGIDEMIYQPCTGNLIVKGNRVYKVKHCQKCENGFGNGFMCEFWWKLTCEDITNSERGKQALSEQIDKE